MKGVVFLGDRKLELREFPDPTPGPRDVILEIKASGMCGSDLHNYRTPANAGGVVTGGIKRAAGVIAGHEPCGVVAAVGSAVTDKEARIGQRVMDHHYDGCGNCKHCRAGWTQMCLEGPVVYGSGGHGAHAKYMKVPVSTLVPLPDSLSFVTGAAISCGTGTAWGALRRVELQGGETIAIFGQGPVGLSATQLAVEMGARVIAIDIAPERRQLARQSGAAEVIDPAAHDMVAAIRALTHGEGAHRRSTPPRPRTPVRRPCAPSARGAPPVSSASGVRSRSTSARISCAARSRWWGRGRSRSKARPSAPSSSPTGRWTWSGSSRTAGGSSRPRKPTGSSTRRRPARPSSCRPDVSKRLAKALTAPAPPTAARSAPAIHCSCGQLNVNHLTLALAKRR
jgi:D-arabinose 1-dehydrogenase-like Zn-dependent alcohol dehydrogenase